MRVRRKTKSREKHDCIRLGLKQEKRQQRQEKLMLKDKLVNNFNRISNEYCYFNLLCYVCQRVQQKKRKMKTKTKIREMPDCIRLGLKQGKRQQGLEKLMLKNKYIYDLIINTL